MKQGFLTSRKRYAKVAIVHTVHAKIQLDSSSQPKPFGVSK